MSDNLFLLSIATFFNLLGRIVTPHSKMIAIKPSYWPEICQLAIRHNVTNVIYAAVQNLSLQEYPNLFVLTTLEQQASLHIVQDTYQQLETEDLFRDFEEKHIPVIALKGIIMKQLYPRPDLRSMTDIDLAIRAEDAEQIRQIMIEHGYQSVIYGQGNQDVYTKESYVTVEIHRRIPLNKGQQEIYFKNIWENCINLEPYKYIYRLNIEDFYIHLISHMAQHMVNGGIGIRFFIDLWIYRNKYEQTWNQEYLNQGLKKLKLDAFACKAQHMAEVWFGEAEREPGDDRLEEFVLNCGLYGSEDVFVIANEAMEGLRDTGSSIQKFKYLARRTFPKYAWMKTRFPVLEKYPLALPIFWFYRIYRNGIRRAGAVRKEIGSLKEIEQSQIIDIENLYYIWGLDRKYWRMWH